MYYVVVFFEVYKQVVILVDVIGDIVVIMELIDDLVKLVFFECDEQGVVQLIWFFGGCIVLLSQLLLML